MQKFAKSGGKTKREVFYIRITLLWHQCSICFMVVGGMDAPATVYRINEHYKNRLNKCVADAWPRPLVRTFLLILLQ
jgi:hypothetical protein